MADPDIDSSDVLQRAEQEVARVHRKLANHGGPLAAETREHADRAEDIAAKERAEAARLRRAEPG